MTVKTKDTVVSTGRRAPKGDKRLRTRSQLIDAAKAVIHEKGYYAVSLEEVAQRAGMSRGAIYGNFANREELIVAVVETLWQPVVPKLQPGASFKDQMHIVGKAVAEAAKARRSMAVGAASFQLYALSNEHMRARIAKENAKIYRMLAKGIIRYIPADKLPMTPNKFVRVMHALTDGLMFEHFMAPDLITEDVIVSAFEALAGRAR